MIIDIEGKSDKELAELWSSLYENALQRNKELSISIDQLKSENTMLKRDIDYLREWKKSITNEEAFKYESRMLELDIGINNLMKENAELMKKLKAAENKLDKINKSAEQCRVSCAEGEEDKFNIDAWSLIKLIFELTEY